MANMALRSRRLKPRTLEAVGVEMEDVETILGTGPSVLREAKQRTTSFADTLSIWEVCDIVKDSAFCSIPKTDFVLRSSHREGRGSEEPETPVEVETKYDREILEDIRAYAQKEKEDETCANCSHVLRGTWQVDGGPGKANNPQLQMMTKCLTLIRLELRAQVQANNTLELWVLTGTRWGETVKQLAPEENDPDEVLSPGKSEEAASKSGGRIYRILTSANSISKHRGPLRVTLECEVNRNETITLVLARGSYHRGGPEKPCEKSSSATAGPAATSVAQEPGTPTEDANLRNSLKRRGSASARRMSASRNLTDAETNSGDGSPKARRRGSAYERRTSTALPPLPVVDEPREEAPETKVLATQALSTLVPEILITPQQAVVRGWGCEDDHFEVRVWTTSPLKKRPEVLTEPKALEATDSSQWNHHLSVLKKTFQRLEEAHEESTWYMRADVAWHARVNLNEDLDVVQGELRRGLMSQDTGTTDFFKYCRSYRQGGFMLLDCIGNELGTRERMGAPKMDCTGCEVVCHGVMGPG